MIGATELFEMLDAWAKETGRHHGETIEWEVIDDLWRDTEDLLAKIVSPKNEAERARAFDDIRAACETVDWSDSRKAKARFIAALEKLEETTTIRRIGAN